MGINGAGSISSASCLKAEAEVRITNQFGGQSIEGEIRELSISKHKKINSLDAKWRKRKRGLEARM